MKPPIALNRVPAFDENTPGFRVDWWRQRPSESHFDYLSFRQGSQEVGRCKIDPRGYLAGEYVGLDTSGPWAQVLYLEVRTDLRGHDLGQALLCAIGNTYVENNLFAFSNSADWFWEKTEWRRIQRLDGDGAFSSLFVRLASSLG